MALTILDAGVIIAILDSSDAHHAAAREAVTQARSRGDDLAIPASAYAEVLVGPYRQSASMAAKNAIQGWQSQAGSTPMRWLPVPSGRKPPSG